MKRSIFLNHSIFLFCELPAYTLPMFLIGLLAFFLFVSNIFWIICQLNTLQISHVQWTVFWCTEVFILMHLSIVFFMNCPSYIMFMKSFPALRLYIHSFKNCKVCFSYLDLFKKHSFQLCQDFWLLEWFVSGFFPSYIS